MATVSTHPTLRAFGRLIGGASLALLAGAFAAGCSSDDGAKKVDDKPTQKTAAKKEAPGLDEKASEEDLTTRRATQRFNEGVEAFKKAAQNGKAYGKAREHFAGALKADPKFAIARYNLAVILEKNGKVAEASNAYREAFDLDPSLDPAVVNLGVLLESRGQDDEARALYEEAIEKNPEAVGPRIRLAHMMHREDNFKDAARLARQALQFDAKSLDAYRLLARLYAEKRKNQLARLIALRGQKLNENDPELTYALAIVAMNDKDVAGARELMRQVIEKKPDHVDARVTLANLALKNRDWKTAEPQLRELIKMEPRNPGLHLSLGLALKGQGRFDEAKQAYLAGLTADETFVEAHMNLGILKLRHLDDPEGAIPHFETFINDPGQKTKKAEKLLDEAKILVQAKKEEQRMMEEMARMEAEAARQAEEEAKRQAEEEKRLAAEGKAAGAEGQPAGAEGQPAGGEGATAEGQPAGDPQPADGQQGQPEEGGAAEEPAPESPPEEAAPPPAAEEPKPKPKPRKKKRRRRRNNKKKPEPKKPSAPEQDDDFFSD